MSLGIAEAARASDAPLALQKSLVIPNVPVGPYSDYLAIDLTGKRLFATPQAAKAVAVLDLESGRVIKMLSIGNPHGIFYSSTMKRLFVVDGASGTMKVFNGFDFSLLKTIPLNLGADGLAYDPRLKLIYVSNGGKEAGMDHSVISVIDPAQMTKLANIPIAASSLEGSIVDSDKQLLYVNLDKDSSAIAVVDLSKRKVVATWKLPRGGHRNMAMALDQQRHRLYVGCRDSALYGSIIVFNTESGRPITTLPIGGWVDGLFVDKNRNRLYASTGVGHVETYAYSADDRYIGEAPVDTDLLAKTSLFSPDLDRLFVSVPHLGDYGLARVMVFAPTPISSVENKQFVKTH